MKDKIDNLLLSLKTELYNLDELDEYDIYIQEIKLKAQIDILEKLKKGDFIK